MNFAERYGPYAVIAGASEGTGRAFARLLARRGISSLLIARRQVLLDALAEEIRAESGIDCPTAAIDLAQPDSAGNVAAAASGREIGLFIANAGADPNGAKFLDKNLTAWTELVQRNVLTMMQCCHHFAAPMRARGRGGLLLVNSGACYGGGSFMAAYTASKAFELNFAESLWAELRPFNVDVLSLVLGMTDTPAFRALLAEKNMPVPQNMAAPEDVAETGIAQLPHGPIYNWGQSNDTAGYAPSSPDTRRARVLAIDAASKHVFGEA